MAAGVTAPNRVLELREASSLSLRELADKCDVSHVTISRVEKGEGNPHPSTRRLIAEALGREVEYVFPTEGAADDA